MERILFDVSRCGCGQLYTNKKMSNSARKGFQHCVPCSCQSGAPVWSKECQEKWYKDNEKAAMTWCEQKMQADMAPRKEAVIEATTRAPVPTKQNEERHKV